MPPLVVVFSPSALLTATTRDNQGHYVDADDEHDLPEYIISMLSYGRMVRTAVGKPPDGFWDHLGWLTYVSVPLYYSQCCECKLDFTVDAYKSDVGCNE